MRRIICLSLVSVIGAFATPIGGCREALEACAPILTGGILTGEKFEPFPLTPAMAAGVGGTWSADVSFFGANATMEGTITSNADPFLDYSFGVMNLTASNLTFSFLFLSPYDGGPFGVLKSSHASSVTDGGAAPDGAVVVKPDAATGFVHNPMVDGSLVTAAAISPGCTLAAPPGFSDNCQGFSFITVPVASGLAGTFGVKIEFNLAPGDLMALTGRVELLQSLSEPIPEPAYTAIIGLALVGLSVTRRFRRV